MRILKWALFKVFNYQLVNNMVKLNPTPPKANV